MLDVKYKELYASLDAYTNEEIFDDHQKQIVHKFTTFSRLPEILIFQLKVLKIEIFS